MQDPVQRLTESAQELCEAERHYQEAVTKFPPDLYGPNEKAVPAFADPGRSVYFLARIVFSGGRVMWRATARQRKATTFKKSVQGVGVEASDNHDLLEMARLMVMPPDMPQQECINE